MPHNRYRELATKKSQGRKLRERNNPDLRQKVDFQYTKIKVDDSLTTRAKIWNLLSLKGHKCKLQHHNHHRDNMNSAEHILQTLKELNCHNVIDEPIACIYKNSYFNIDLQGHNKIHKLLLSIL